MNLEWLYEVFVGSQCRLRYVSTKHQIADMHANAIAKGEVWTQLIKLAQLLDTSLVDSKTIDLTVSRTTSLFVIIPFRDFLSVPQSPIGFAASEDNSIGPAGPHALFQCPTCRLVESDTKRLKWDLKAGRFCCFNCDGLI